MALSLGCGESKKGEPKVTAPQNVVADPAGSPPLQQSKPSDLGAMLKGNSGNVLADPGGDVPSDVDGEGLDAVIAEVEYEAGKEHLEKREFREAIAVLKKAVKSDPKHGRAFFALGQAHNGLGKPGPAGGAFQQAIKAVGDSDEEWVAEAYRLLGYAIREAGGERSATRRAWEAYVDRTVVENDQTREVKKLLIPLRRL